MTVRIIARYAVIGLLALSACVSRVEPVAVERSRQPKDQEALWRRARRLWAARQDLDCPTLFLFENFEGNEATNKEAFIEWCRKEEPLQIVDYELRGSEVDGDLGWIHAVYHVQFRKAPDAPLPMA